MKRFHSLISLPLLILLSTGNSSAQKTAVPVSQLCTRLSALDIINQQNATAKTIENMIQRIEVMLRVADLAWPYQQDRARVVFLEAFDVASQYYKESGDADRRDSQFHVTRMPDQRFKVIAAYAKRDSAAARKLATQVLEEQKDTGTKSGSDEDSRKTAEKLLNVAQNLISIDRSAAISFARTSLRYAATIQLPDFLYALATVDRIGAEQFYGEALTAYSNAPMDQFLYLSSFPFGNPREAGEMPTYSMYKVPDGFVPSLRLQRLFIQRLLARTQMALEAPVDAVPTSDYRRSDSAQLWMALSRLQKQIEQTLPELAEAALQSRERLFALLTASSQRTVSNIISSDQAPKKSFDEQVEVALKIANPDRRDQQLSFAVTAASSNEPLEKVVDVIDKISDSNVRPLLLNWFYFFRAQALIKDKNLSDARKLALKVSELDQRAYLYSRIAEESMKENEDQMQAREMLNEIADVAGKSAHTVVTARALLALAYLYAKIDSNRGIEELANAVKSINRLEAPDFSQQYVRMKIEGKTFGSYAAFQTPGFSPENAFREIAKVDFDGSLNQAATLNDKSLRALTTLAVIEPCLSRRPDRLKK